MDRKTVGSKLKALRLAKGFSPTKLRSLTGINYSQIQNYEEGVHFPRLDLLNKWLEACDTTLSTFLGELEQERGGRNKAIDIVPGFEDYYANLTTIIRSGQNFYIQGICANLQSMAETSTAAASREGNLRPKEKKRARKAS